MSSLRAPADLGFIRTRSATEPVSYLFESSRKGNEPRIHLVPSWSLDHVIGELLKLCRHVEAKRSGRLEIDDHFELRRMLHRKFGRLGAPEDFIDVYRPLPELIERVESIGEQSTLLGIKGKWIDGRQTMPRRERNNKFAVREGDNVWCDDQAVIGLARAARCRRCLVPALRLCKTARAK
jgi:hypothetical protein